MSDYPRMPWKKVEEELPVQGQECLVMTTDRTTYSARYYKARYEYCFIRKCDDDAPEGAHWYTTISDVEMWQPI